ncbi:GFA family protein [Aspergillus fijiensis CBS 313.89]|uniref:CENP-V/GFA domain-containing protein n=1 Tax=Aspergillus fijiensis CBS 313.89 TaxID=1448319 RepID=A0A8G1RK13_9EURO|nr:uncharacterized protein BO72DRAFT_231949 [Aspergillus fijiensis CBS 313.89]RAK73568.1 hypothetical protein BO72DRAFT_231949 [Aspergillus fijiensis CBS 313.89]
MTTKGSCFCTAIRIECTSPPLTTGLCHCHDCRKLTGSAYSYSVLVPTGAFRVVAGTPKAVAKTADSGNAVRNYFCGDCGSPLYGHKIHADGRPAEVTVVRAGVLDDAGVLERRPEAELFTGRRLGWVGAVEGAGQVCGMLDFS